MVKVVVFLWVPKIKPRWSPDYFMDKKEKVHIFADLYLNGIKCIMIRLFLTFKFQQEEVNWFLMSVLRPAPAMRCHK